MYIYIYHRWQYIQKSEENQQPKYERGMYSMKKKVGKGESERLHPKIKKSYMELIP